MKFVWIDDKQPLFKFSEIGGRVNSTSWLGRAPRTCLITKMSTQFKRRSGQSGPFRMIVEVQERKKGWQHLEHPAKRFAEIDFNELGLSEERLFKGHVPSKW